MEYLSKECHDNIAAELERLINVEFPKVKDELSEARAQGDLSENFEYRAARRAQSKMIGRIKYLQRVLMYSRVIDTKMLQKNHAALLNEVTFTNLDTNVQMAYTLVSPHEMNLQEAKLSIKSPIGQALMGKQVGDIVEVRAPASSFKLRIDKIS